jgi:hypothetical protein
MQCQNPECPAWQGEHPKAMTFDTVIASVRDEDA